jgi:hypothetical protein
VLTQSRPSSRICPADGPTTSRLHTGSQDPEGCSSAQTDSNALLNSGSLLEVSTSSQPVEIAGQRIATTIEPARRVER